MLNCQNYLPQEGRERRQRLVLNIQTGSFIKWLMFSSPPCAIGWISCVLRFTPHYTTTSTTEYFSPDGPYSSSSCSSWNVVYGKETIVQKIIAKQGLTVMSSHSNGTCCYVFLLSWKTFFGLDTKRWNQRRVWVIYVPFIIKLSNFSIITLTENEDKKGIAPNSGHFT